MRIANLDNIRGSRAYISDVNDVNDVNHVRTNAPMDMFMRGHGVYIDRTCSYGMCDAWMMSTTDHKQGLCL